MIEETATVLEVDGEFAWLETNRQSACGACSANKGCGTAVLAKVVGARRARVRALNRAGAAPGEQVVIGLREEALLKGSVAVYAVPLLAMLSGAVLGDILGAGSGRGPESMAIVLGLGGFGAGLAWLKRFTARIRRDPRYQPVVLRRRAVAGTTASRALSV